MKPITILTLVGLLAGGHAMAQDKTWSYGAKFGTGGALSGVDQQGARELIGAGFWVERKLSAQGSVFAEAGYTQFKADRREVTQFGPGYYRKADGTVGTGYIHKYRAADTRKDNLEGYTLAAGYRYHVNSDLSLHATLGLGLWVSQQEVLGEIGLLAKPDPSATNTADLAPLAQEGLNFAPAKRAIKPLLGLGVRYAFSDTAFVDGGVRFLQYSRVNYVPFAYTGRTAAVESANKGKATFELNIGIRF